jgi:hypothetical protein
MMRGGSFRVGDDASGTHISHNPVSGPWAETALLNATHYLSLFILFVMNVCSNGMYG